MLAQDATDLTGDASGVIGEQTVPTPMPTVTADAHLGEQHLLWANDEQRQQLREQCIHKAGDITKTGQAFLFFVNPMYKAVGSQQLSASCVFCSRTVISTGSTRLVDHLLKCALVTNEVRKGFNQLRVESSKKRKMKDEESVLIHEQAQLAKLEHDNRQQQLKQQCIRASLKTSEIAAADMAIADFFYMNGLSFSAADPSHGSVYQKMVEAIKHTPSGYVPPNHHKLGGPLLDDCYSRMWKDIAARDPDGKNKKAYGCTYVSDGWDSIDSLPLVNSAFITAGDGGVYWRSVDTSGKTKDADYLASLMISDIYDFGCMNVVSVVTDTCNTMKACWSIVQDEFPWISVVPCQPHVVSLLLKDMSKEKDIEKLIQDEGIVVSWFSHHRKPLAILRKKVKEKFGKTKELVKAAATRFWTNTLVGQRLLDLKQPLQATVVDSEYQALNIRDGPDIVEEGNAERVTRQNKGATAQSLVLDGSNTSSFWSRVQTHVQTTLPAFKLLRRHDSSAPTIGKVYHGWFELGTAISQSDASYKDRFKAKFDDRWAYGHSDFAAAAYVVDPEFRGHDQASNDEVMNGFMNTVEKIALLRQVRSLQDLDGRYSTLWKKRRDLIAANPEKQNTYESYPTYPTTDDAAVMEYCKTVNEQLANYRDGVGVFSRAWVLKTAETMPAHRWWLQFGSSVSELQSFATMVLAQPASASICERINSEFAFVKDRRRNRLADNRANKLVVLFHNLRLMARKDKLNYCSGVDG